jgi:ribosome-binding protein aMBF1 (putative translation factor)
MKKPSKKFIHVRDGQQILNRLTGDNPELRARVATAKLDFRVGQLITEARSAARLTQRQLADLVGTQQSVIARLESAEYRGHSITMLSRIADALEQRLQVSFVPRHGSRARSGRRRPRIAAHST